MAQAGPFSKQPATTAQLLGAYHRELEAQGIGPEEVRTLTVEAGRQLLRGDGLTVDGSAVETPHLCPQLVQAQIAYRALQELFVETTSTPEDRVRKLRESYPTPDELRKRVEE